MDGSGRTRWTRSPRRRAIVLVTIAAVLVVGVGATLQLSRLGDPGDPAGLTIRNRTDMALFIYGVVREGGTDSKVTAEISRAELGPGGSTQTHVGCGAGEWVARTNEVWRSQGCRMGNAQTRRG